MHVTATTNTAASSTAGTENIASQSSQLLGQSDFIELLVTQMTSQDPLNPMSNQDMLTQMVQFSTLQQSTGLQTELARMQNSQNLTQANALLGRHVSLLTDAGAFAQGTVSGVELDSGTAKIVVDDIAYDLSQIIAITTPTPAS